MMILYRGVRNNIEMKNIIDNQSAGGKARDPSAARPTNSEISSQKGTFGECYPLKKDQVIPIPDFVEYTTDFRIAEQFGPPRGGVVEIEVSEEYVLVLDNDPFEHGCFIRSEAPVRVISSIQGET